MKEVAKRYVLRLRCSASVPLRDFVDMLPEVSLLRRIGGQGLQMFEDLLGCHAWFLGLLAPFNFRRIDLGDCLGVELSLRQGQRREKANHFTARIADLG